MRVFLELRVCHLCVVCILMMRKVFQIGLILSCLAVLSTAMLEWKSILKKPEAGIGAEKSVAAERTMIGQTA